MRIAVCNRYWATAGGGEGYALGIARALLRHGDVELLTPDGVDWDLVGERLSADLDPFRRRVAPFDDPLRMSQLSAGYDVFVNTTFATIGTCATDMVLPRVPGILVVHFPFRVDDGVNGIRGATLRAALRTHVLDRGPAYEWGPGFTARERGNGPSFCWTDGDAQLLLWIPAGRTFAVEITLGSDRPSATKVELSTEDEPLAAAKVEPGGGWPVVRFTVRGREDRSPVPVRIVSDTFRAAEQVDPDDYRMLGVQVAGVRIGNGPVARAVGRAPVLERAFTLRRVRLYRAVAVNSEFTRSWVRRWWRRDARVVYPAVQARRGTAKSPLILSVGRFFPPSRGHSKRQLELVLAFRRMVESGLTGWELHLVGGCQPEDRGYLEQVRAAAASLPVSIHVDAPGSVLSELYARAAVYWHATGLGEDPARAPQRQEHFGVSVVEAMSAGAVPLVYPGGGPAETVVEGAEGFHFRTAAELAERTRAVIDDPRLRSTLSAAAERGAARYSPGAMADRLDSVLEEVHARR
ncbi:MAG TPA: glycosyltransferase [Actinomycetota bacterium]|nr:glycosyltransferase [Actinomycetota bacterium]